MSRVWRTTKPTEQGWWACRYSHSNDDPSDWTVYYVELDPRTGGRTYWNKDTQYHDQGLCGGECWSLIAVDPHPGTKQPDPTGHVCHKCGDYDPQPVPKQSDPTVHAHVCGKCGATGTAFRHAGDVQDPPVPAVEPEPERLHKDKVLLRVCHRCGQFNPAEGSVCKPVHTPVYKSYPITEPKGTFTDLRHDPQPMRQLPDITIIKHVCARCGDIDPKEGSRCTGGGF